MLGGLDRLCLQALIHHYRLEITQVWSWLGSEEGPLREASAPVMGVSGNFS